MRRDLALPSAMRASPSSGRTTNGFSIRTLELRSSASLARRAWRAFGAATMTRSTSSGNSSSRDAPAGFDGLQSEVEGVLAGIDDPQFVELIANAAESGEIEGARNGAGSNQSNASRHRTSSKQMRQARPEGARRRKRQSRLSQRAFNIGALHKYGLRGVMVDCAGAAVGHGHRPPPCKVPPTLGGAASVIMPPTESREP